MECNKRNRKNQRFEFKSNLGCFAKSNEIFFSYFCDRFCKLKRFFSFFDLLFFTFLADLSKRNVALF